MNRPFPVLMSQGQTKGTQEMSTPIDYADRIAKLLSRAEGTNYEAEAELMRKKAYELMAKYSIEQAEIDARLNATGQRKNEPIVEKRIKITGIFRYGLNQLSFEVVGALENVGVRAYYVDKQLALVPRADGTDRPVDAVHFVIVGRESDVDQAILLVTSLQLQAAAAMTTWWQANPRRDSLARGLAFRSRRSFIMSFGVGAGQKIRLAQRRARSSKVSSGAELVIRDKNAAVDAFLEAKQLATKRDRNQAGLRSAQQSGFDAGQRADTGDPTVGKTNRKEVTS